MLAARVEFYAWEKIRKVPFKLKNPIMTLVGMLLVLILPSVIAYKTYEIYGSLGKHELDFNSFLQHALWLQVLIAWIALVFVAFAASQVIYTADLIRQEKHRSEYEAYLPLIGPEMHSTKRFILMEDVQSVLQELKVRLKEDLNEAMLKGILEDIRCRIDKIGKSNYWPLLKEGTMSLDHIETLISRYNYICNLIERNGLREGIEVGLSIDDFKNHFRTLWQFIRLRRMISPTYASHWHKYYLSKYGSPID